jgi:hypothetical protein
MSQPIEIKLPWPAKALHSNARCHWAVKAAATAKARQEASMVAKSAGVPCWPDADILIEYWPDNRRSDCHNAASAMKPLIDGLADAMGCDDKAFRVDYPTTFAGTKKGGEVVFRIYPPSAFR